MGRNEKGNIWIIFFWKVLYSAIICDIFWNKTHELQLYEGITLMTVKIIRSHYLLKNKKSTFQCFYWNAYTDFRGVIPGLQWGKWRNNLKMMPRSVYSLARLAGWRVWVVLHDSQWRNLNTGIFGKTWNSCATAVWKKVDIFFLFVLEWGF